MDDLCDYLRRLGQRVPDPAKSAETEKLLVEWFLDITRDTRVRLPKTSGHHRTDKRNKNGKSGEGE